MLKRLFDIVLSIVLLVILSPAILGIAALMVLRRETPIFYVSERMKTVDTPMQMVKFRTMKPARSEAENAGVSGGDKSDRITALGRSLRKYRLDELPQLWNILKGDMSFVGPRPPLRRYTEKFPEIYRDVLSCKPGVTGLASCYFHKAEERILAQAETQEMTEHLYETRCIPRKARLDLIYRDNQSICLDFHLLYLTARKVLKRG